MSRNDISPVSAMRRLASEPLVGFLLLGLVAYALYGWVTPDATETIVIDGDTVRLLQARREELLGRALTPEERASIHVNLIDEEILLREARRRGLERTDLRVRERLLQLMRNSFDEPPVEPSREQLEAFFNENLDRYWDGEELSFEHVLFPHGSPDLPTDPAGLLERLEDGSFEPPSNPEHGVHESRTATTNEIRAVQGRAFAEQVLALDRGAWHGPIDSPAGLHYFKLLDRRELPRPAFEPLESYVRQDWEIDRRKIILQDRLAPIRKRYRIVSQDE